jgi:hypothetical protein
MREASWVKFRNFIFHLDKLKQLIVKSENQVIIYGHAQADSYLYSYIAYGTSGTKSRIASMKFWA